VSSSGDVDNADRSVEMFSPVNTHDPRSVTFLGCGSRTNERRLNVMRSEGFSAGLSCSLGISLVSRLSDASMAVNLPATAS
jgi:hypothetical protein